MLPALGRLRLSRTGEFYPLSDSEVNRFAEEERQDPITLEDFQTDDGDTWRTFRVRSETPGADGEYTHFYYSAAALWRHYNSATHVVDPLTRQPIWYEDWVALHDAYAPSDSMRSWVYSLPTRDPGTVKAQPPQSPEAEHLYARTIPLFPTPVPVRRQNGVPRSMRRLSEEEEESERAYGAHNRASERFHRALRADDPSLLEELLEAQVEADRTNRAIQAMLDRRAEGGNETRQIEARLRRSLVEEGALTRQRHVDAARARWFGEQAESHESHMQLTLDLQASRAEWGRIMEGPDPTRERLRDQSAAISVLEQQMARVLRLLARSVPRDDPRREQTLRSTQQALRDINAHHAHRRNVLWALDHPFLVNDVLEPTDGLLRAIERRRADYEPPGPWEEVD